MVPPFIAQPSPRTFLLHNLLYCHTCGHALHGRTQKNGRRVYVCPNGRTPTTADTPHHTTTICAVEAEAHVWQTLQNLLADPWKIASVWRALREHPHDTSLEIPLDTFTARIRHAITARDAQTRRDLLQFLVSRIDVSAQFLHIEYRAKFDEYTRVARVVDSWLALANFKARQLLWVAQEFKQTWWVDGRLEQVPHIFAHGFAPIYLLWMTFTSVLIAVGYVQVGLALDGLLIIMLLYFVGYLPPSNEARLAWACALPPILRLLSYSVPIPNTSLAVQLGLVGVPALIATLIMMHALQQPLSVYGIRLRNLPLQFAIAPIGIVVGLLQWKLFGPQLSILYSDLVGVERTAFLSLFITGVTEELVFRGVLQQGAAAVYRTGQYRGSGLIFANIAFASMHVGYGPIAIIFSFCVGMLYSRLTYATGSVFGVLWAHGLSCIVILWLMAF